MQIFRTGHNSATKQKYVDYLHLVNLMANYYSDSFKNTFLTLKIIG